MVLNNSLQNVLIIYIHSNTIFLTEYYNISYIKLPTIRLKTYTQILTGYKEQKILQKHNYVYTHVNMQYIQQFDIKNIIKYKQGFIYMPANFWGCYFWSRNCTSICTRKKFLLHASFRQKFYFWHSVSKKKNAICYGMYKKQRREIINIFSLQCLNHHVD